MTTASGTVAEPFEGFFHRATGKAPYGYQVRLAANGLPAVLGAPTGSGKTGLVLAWLWRLLNGPGPATVPRRLVYALPQHSLVEQVASDMAVWLARLGLDDESGGVALHVAVGGEGAAQRQWRLNMHRPAIIVGTVDSLVSKALNRGYGIGRTTYPIDFALVTNGAHWVIDEARLCPESTTTLRQLAAFARTFGTAEPFGLTCVSATVPEVLLDTVDNPLPGPAEVLAIRSAERTGELALRLGARRTVRRLPAAPGDHAAIAATAADRHQPGTLTLVVMNSVEAARQVYAALPAGPADSTLLHSRFRGHERQALVSKVTGPPGPAGHIVVATGVVEAGLDLDAALLVTEAAPWPCIVRRAGRCNSTGLMDDAQLCWMPPATHHPYLGHDVAAAGAELAALEGAAVTGEDLLRRVVPVTDPAVAVLRRGDLVGLFDTATDLSGADLDIGPYVHDADDLDVQLAWAIWDTSRPAESMIGEDRGLEPPDDARAPAAQWRCPVPLSAVRTLVERVPVWRLDHAAGRWATVTAQDPARPGEMLLVAAADGGYHPVSGCDPAACEPVTDCPELVPRARPADGTEESPEADAAGFARSGWVSLQQHSDETADQAKALLAAMMPVLPDDARKAVVTAAYLHDAGKAHDIWQDALCRLAPPERAAEINGDRPWAKSGTDGRLQFDGGVRFRHELASLMLIDGPLAGQLAAAADTDLARYLILAHHGMLRVQVRDSDQADPKILLGLEQGITWAVPPMFGQPATELTVDLSQFEPGGERSWTRAALALRDRYGPFVLAYLETVVRIADWRASAGVPLAQ